MSEPLLVKIGGSLKGAEEVLEELAPYPGPLVLVHGGGPEIGAFLARLGFETRFERGMRLTPPEQMEAVEMVLTRLGKVLAFGLSQRGRPALGLSGRDALVLKGERIPGLGRVGRVTEVRVEVLKALLGAGYTPLLAPIAWDEEGVLNVNADLAAGAVAGALGWPALFLTDVEGVYLDPKDPESRLTRLGRKEAEDLIRKGVVQGGMIPKVESALFALEAGAPWAAIARGRKGVLLGVLEGRLGTRFQEG